MIPSITKVEIPPAGVVSGAPTKVTIDYRIEFHDMIVAETDGAFEVSLSSSDKPPRMPVFASQDDFHTHAFLVITGAKGDCRVTFRLLGGGVEHVSLVKVRAQ